MVVSDGRRETDSGSICSLVARVASEEYPLGGGDERSPPTKGTESVCIEDVFCVLQSPYLMGGKYPEDLFSLALSYVLPLG